MLEPRFYLAVAACFPLMQLAPGGWRARWFGLLNLAALALLVDTRAAALLAVFSAALWAGLYAHGRLAARALKGPAAALLVGLYAAPALLFVLHKSFLDSYGFLVGLRASLQSLGAPETLPRILAAMSFSYVFLRMVDAVRSVSGGDRLLDPLSLSGYFLPFFMVVSGPVNTYSEHASMDGQPAPPPSFAGFLSAIELIVSGLFFKVVLAEGWRLFLIGNSPAWPAGTWLNTAAVVLYVFLEFYGYSVTALGVGRLLGVPVPVNFRAPFLSVSVTEFFARWHMSLGNFVRQNLFIPLQVAMVRRMGRRYAYATNLMALVLSFGFVGLWHRFTVAFLLWGCSMGLVMTAEKLLRDRWGIGALKRYSWMARTLAVLGPVYVLLIVVGSLTLVMPQLVGNPQ